MSRESDALDRHITGNYGEDQFPDYDDRDAICQVSNCEEESVDGVLCAAHQPPEYDSEVDYFQKLKDAGVPISRTDTGFKLG